MPKGKRGGNNAHDGDISIEQEHAHLTPLGQSKEIVPVAKQFRVTPATEVRVIEVARMICDGKSKQTCLDYVQSAQGCGLQQAKYYYQAALNWLVPDDMDGYKKGLLQANVERLEKIIEDGIAKQTDAKRGADYLRTAKDAIAELNKMLGVGSNRVTVAESAEGDKAITIEFN